MGEHQIEQGVDARQIRAFTKALLGDLGALEQCSTPAGSRAAADAVGD